MVVVWYLGKTLYVVWYVLTVWYGNSTSIWYGTFAVWYLGTMPWMYYMAKFAWCYGMFQYVRSVWVEYVIRTSSSVTTLYIDHWKVFENISNADRQTDRQTDRFASTAADTQFYKLKIQHRFTIKKEPNENKSLTFWRTLKKNRLRKTAQW